MIDAYATECFTAGQQRPEKLDRRQLKDGCVGRQAMMTRQSGNADGHRLVAEFVSEVRQSFPT